MIIGIGTPIAIFYISEYEALSDALPAAEAARMASRNRLRRSSPSSVPCCR